LSMKKYMLILSFLLSINFVSGQDTEIEPSDIESGNELVMDVALGEMCVDELELQAKLKDDLVNSGECLKKALDTPANDQALVGLEGQVSELMPFIFGFSLPNDTNTQKKEVCESILTLGSQNHPPIEFKKKDDKGKEWKIRFHFGFSRTQYWNTDMHLNSSRVNVLVRDFEFDERTSANYYNPANWTSIDQAFKWIDEPTNTFAFSFERDKDVFYFTAFHPKFLKSKDQQKHVTGTIDGVEVDQVMYLNKPFTGYNNVPGEMHLVRFENTHYQMDWQIGYGRKLVIFDGEKSGKLSYTPRVDVGLTSGQNYTVYLKENEYWEYDGFKDRHRVQGVNASIGHRVEYQRGRVGLHVDQRMVFSRLNQGFMDGTANFNMQYSPITFGVSFDLYTIKKK